MPFADYFADAMPFITHVAMALLMLLMPDFFSIAARRACYAATISTIISRCLRCHATILFFRHLRAAPCFMARYAIRTADVCRDAAADV